MSFEEAPIITRNVPGSTIQRIPESSIRRSDGPRWKLTVFDSPGASDRRSNPFNAMTGRATEASTSRR